MKKMKVILLSAVLVLGMSLTACGEKNPYTDENVIAVERIEEIYEAKGIVMPTEVVDGVEYKASVELEPGSGIFDMENAYTDIKIGDTYESGFGIGTDKEQANLKVDEYCEYLVEKGYTLDKTGAAFGNLFLKDGVPSVLVDWTNNHFEPEQGQQYIMTVTLYEAE